MRAGHSPQIPHLDGPTWPNKSDAGDPLGCVVVGSILFNVLSVCGGPCQGRLMLVVRVHFPHGSKRNVIVLHAVGQRRLAAAGHGRASGGAGGALAAAFGRLGAAEVEGFELAKGFATLFTGLLVFPFFLRQATFADDGIAFLEESGNGFAGLAPGLPVGEGNFFFGLSIFAFPATVHGNAKLRDGRAFGRVSRLRIAGEIAFLK